MLRNKNIICFGSENWDYPGFQQSLMRRLSSANQIIFVNPIGTRKIQLRMSLLKIYFNRFKSIFKKDHALSTNCIIYSPRIIPLVYNKSIMKLNQRIIKFELDRLLAKYNFDQYILWIGTPTASFVLDLFHPDLIIYHAVDRYSEFSFVNRKKIKAYEKEISQNADAIICTSDAIRNDLIRYNKSVYTVTHAVDFDHFSLIGDTTIIPDDLINISNPIIGYFGGLSERVNFQLLKKIAQQHTFANVVLIGKAIPNLKELEEVRNLPNVHILGYKNYDKLPYYLKHFSVCLIPYHVNELMNGVDPIKLREYLCQGKPVVSTKLPEVEKIKDIVYLANNEDDFIAKVGDALNENKNSLIDDRIRFAKQCNWTNKINEISDIISNGYANSSKDVNYVV